MVFFKVSVGSETIKYSVYQRVYMETTTIKVSKKTKAQLDRRRQREETYDALIARLVRTAPRDDLRSQLIAGAKAYRDRDVQLVKEWAAVDAPWPEY